MLKSQRNPGRVSLGRSLSLLFIIVVATSAWALTALADGPSVPAGTTAVETQAAPAQPQQPGIAGMLTPFLLMFGVVYFLMIRPQQKKLKEQQDMLSALAHGDEVLTSGGMLGTVKGITDKVVTLEIADGVRIKMLKSQVQQVVKGPIKDLTA